MDIKDGFIGTVGNTPLIRLNSFSEETGCEILGKAEFLNPGGSVKDRAALYIIQDAEKKGLLKPGGTVVEGTAGNTGIGLAHICNAKGYKCLIIIPETQSQEKMDALRTLGAEADDRSSRAGRGRWRRPGSAGDGARCPTGRRCRRRARRREPAPAPER